MPRSKAPHISTAYDSHYQRMRRRLLASGPRCAHCKRRRAQTADHQPPISRHVHRSGTGCCVLLPSCFDCMRLQAGALGGPRQPAPPVIIPDPDPEGFDVDSEVWDRAGWLDDLRDIPADGWWPRLMTVPHPDAIGSWGPEFAAWVLERHALTLYWWQLLVATRLLEYNADGGLCWPEAFLSVARQSGKSVLVAMLCDWRRHQHTRFGEDQLVMHTADTLQHAQDVQAICYPRARADGDLVRLAAGAVGIYGDGGSWLVRSQTSVVGSSVSLAVVDEAHGVKLPTVTQNLAPTMLERKDTQLLLVSTAHTLCTELMPMWRIDALAELAEPAATLMLEWSATPTLAVDDPIGWRQSSPHWSPKRARDIARAARQAVALPEGHEVRYGFDCQYRNRWPASGTRGAGERLLEPDLWARCGRRTITPSGAGWCAVEDNRGNGAAVAFAAVDTDGVFEIDGMAFDTWDESLRWARKFIDASPGSRVVVGASMVEFVPRDFPGRVQMRRAGSTETRRALPLLRSLVAEGRIVHENTPDLDEQINDARVQRRRRRADAGARATLGPAAGGIVGVVAGPRAVVGDRPLIKAIDDDMP